MRARCPINRRRVGLPFGATHCCLKSTSERARPAVTWSTSTSATRALRRPICALGCSYLVAWVCMSKSRNTEDQRRVLKEKTSPRLMAPSNFAGRIPLAKDRGRHYFGTHLSTKMADSVWACMSKSRNTEDQRRVLKEKTSPRLIAPSNFAGRIPLAKDRGRHYCIGTHLSTKMADSVENRVVPAAGKR